MEREAVKLIEIPQLVDSRDFGFEFKQMCQQAQIEQKKFALYRDDSTKNRYSDIVPFVHNRVLLSNGEYINASFMRNFDGSNLKRFIASQGPLKTTIGDHWDMIWTEGVTGAFVIGKLSDGNKEKIAPYWPTKVGESFKIDGLRQIVVTLVHLHTTSFPDEGEALGRYLSYELKLESIDGEKRELTLHHFEDWPDLGAISPRILAWISEEVRTIKSSAPVLVHCSAGVGRTGAVLAVVNSMEDVINQLVKEGKKMDEIEISVFEKILKLRQDRMESVERPLQYESVYRAIAEVVKVWTNRQGDVWKHI